MDKKLILATGSDLRYLSNQLLIRLLESIDINSNFDNNYLIFLNKFEISTPFTKTKICLIDEESIVKRNSNNCLQHGEFSNSPNFNEASNDSDIICFIDGDIEVQRNLSKDEIDFLKNFENGDVYVGYNAGPNDMLMDEFHRLGPMKNLPPVFENAVNYKIYNTGVLIMNKYSWNKLKNLYIQFFDEVNSLFYAYPKQQWLISFLIQDNEFFKIHEMPYDFHNHNHFPPPEGTVIKDGVVTHNNKVALFKHKWI